MARATNDVKGFKLSTERLNMAVIGCGDIVGTHLLALSRETARASIVACCDTDSARAEMAVRESGSTGARVVLDYRELLDDPDVHAVDLCLPHYLHAPVAIAFARAGKHVLCEKPMATSVAECAAMNRAAAEAKRQLMIAYRLRYEPFNMTAIDLCRRGEIGKLRTISATNTQDVEAPNIRLSKALGGGPVGDVGIYCLNAARYLTGEEPAEVTAVAQQPTDDPRFREVPESVAFAVKFPSGAIANCDCGFGSAESRRFRVQGTTGLIDMANAFAYRGQRLMLGKQGYTSEMKIDAADHFAAEMDHFSACIAAGKPNRTPGEEGLADMRAIAAIEESYRTGRRVVLGG